MCDWLTTPEAAKALRTTENVLGHLGTDGYCIRRRTKSPNGKGARGNGWLWYRPDVEALDKVRRECHIGMTAAARVLKAIRQSRLDSVVKSAN